MNLISEAEKPILENAILNGGLHFAINRRQKTLIITSLCSALMIGIIIAAQLMSNEGIATNFSQQNLAPSWSHPFGTDWLGRDMFTRTIKGLAISIQIGLLASSVSVVIALVLGMCAATMGEKVDAVISWLVDLFMGVPHLVALVLIAVVLGGGAKGVIIGVALTHWPSLTRVIRAEVMQVRTSQYVLVSRHLGRSRWWIASKHILPHLLPQFMIGLILLFPHAILHEAALTFLGIGLSPHTPAVGILLSESMRHLSTGYWWLGVLPGASLLVMVKCFDILGTNIDRLLDPRTAQE